MSEKVWRKARKKPVVVEFREVEPKEKVDLAGAMGELVKTREGLLSAFAGRDFIIRGVEGELYPIDKKIFEETYEVVEEVG